MGPTAAYTLGIAVPSLSGGYESVGLPFGVRVPALFKTPTGAALLSFLIPGLGQASAGYRVRGAIAARCPVSLKTRGG
jgi:hypothetical protein